MNVLVSVWHVHHSVEVVVEDWSVKLPVPQFHSLAFDKAKNSSRLIVLAVLHMFDKVKSLADGHASLNVYVAVFAVWFPKLSFTYHVIFTLHGCCAAIVIDVALHQFHVPNLYAFVGSHAHHQSLALIIFKCHGSHSYHDLFSKSKFGQYMSNHVICRLSYQVLQL